MRGAARHAVRRALDRMARGDLRRTGRVAGDSAPVRALEWLRRNELPSGGIRVHADANRAYPEVSGYLVPTLLDCGEAELARRVTRWLLCIQRGDGAYMDPDGARPHVFDTAQVLRGLLAGADLHPGVAAAARRAASFLEGQLVDAGRAGFVRQYDGSIPESVLLFALPPLRDAAESFGLSALRAATERCADHYLRSEDCLAPGTLTHFLAYELDALLALGRADVALPILEKLRAEQAEDGGVRAFEGTAWVCTPGLAQLAICWYAVGFDAAAERALDWLERHQQPDGGFLGSVGAGARYFAESRIAWPVKFYLDACLLRAAARRQGSPRTEALEASDERRGALLEGLGAGDRVLEVAGHADGLSRWLEGLRPGVSCQAVADGSGAESVPTRSGHPERLPVEDEAFDLVFALHLLEHGVNPEAALREMIRAARPGARILVASGDEASAEDIGAVSRALRAGCDEVSSSLCAAASGVATLWRARKRSRLSGAQWNAALIDAAERERLLERLRLHRFSPWGRQLPLHTRPGERVLEIGSGTGEISLALALGGRRVTLVDVSGESLAFARGCARELGVDIETVQADATAPLPFAGDSFDCVWSSGLLEHFERDERRAMLREWARVGAGRLLSLVPNAACLAYRAGKSRLESAGRWRYGLELPLHSLRDDYAAAGLAVSEEYSVGARHALHFLPREHPLRAALAEVFTGDSEPDPWNQGYMLLTIGSRPR